MTQGTSLSFPEDSDIGVRIRYIAMLNPKGVNQLAYKFGWQVPSDDVDSRVGFLNRLLVEEGEGNFDNIFSELMKIHPDATAFAEMHTNNGYHYDNNKYDGFALGDIVKGASDLGTAAIGKIGQGKQNAANIQMSTKANTQAIIQQRQAQIDQEHKTKRTMLYVFGIGGAVVLIAIVGLIIWAKMRK
jgi:hypothetical protein